MALLYREGCDNTSLRNQYGRILIFAQNIFRLLFVHYLSAYSASTQALARRRLMCPDHSLLMTASVPTLTHTAVNSTRQTFDGAFEFQRK